MSIASATTTGLTMLEVVVHSLETIQALTGVGGPPAQGALQAIDAIAKSLLDGIKAEATPDTIMAALKQESTDITSNDAKIDQQLGLGTKLDAKFDKGAP